MLEELSNAELNQAVIESQRQIDIMQADQAVLLSEWDLRRGWADNGSRSAAHRLARETGISIPSAQVKMHRARTLRSMPLTLDAFLNGTISTDRVDLLRKANNKRTRLYSSEGEAGLLECVQQMDFIDAEDFIREWLDHADEFGCKKRQQRFIDCRELVVAKSFHGVYDITAVLDPVNGEIFYNSIKKIEREFFEADWAEAKERLGDFVSKEDLKRTDRQRMADALVEMAIRASSSAPGAKRPEPLITFVVGAEAGKDLIKTAAGNVVGVGQVVPRLNDAQYEAVLFDGPKRIMDITEKRFFTGASDRALDLLANGHCEHESGCDVPVSDCQNDHVPPWVKGGKTAVRNGQKLCDFHNRWKGAGPPAAA